MFSHFLSPPLPHSFLSFPSTMLPSLFSRLRPLPAFRRRAWQVSGRALSSRSLSGPGPGLEAERRKATANPVSFWGAAAKDIDWVTAPSDILDASDPTHPVWFKGGELNTCWNACDRHVVGGRGHHLAIIHDSPVTGGSKTSMSFKASLRSFSSSSSSSSHSPFPFRARRSCRRRRWSSLLRWKKRAASAWETVS